MPVAATKVQDYLRELDGPCTYIPELRLWAIIQDCTRLLKEADHIEASYLHQVIGHANLHLGRNSEAVAAYRIASRLTQSDPTHRNNIGAALLRLDKPAEALEALEYIYDLDRDPLISEAGNLGEALAGAGYYKQAVDLFWHCASVANYQRSLDLLALASLAAELGFAEHTVRLFALHLAVKRRIPLGDAEPRDFINNTPDQYSVCLRGQAHLRAVISFECTGSIKEDAPRSPGHEVFAAVRDLPSDFRPNAVPPAEYAVAPQLKLGSEEWGSYLEMVADPPQPTSALRGLFSAKH